MTDESAILRAYALLSQGKHDEAELMLKRAPGALNTPSGADLFARLRFDQGFADEARQIWERIHAAFPDFEPANKALAAFVSPPEQQGGDDEEEEGRKVPFVAIFFMLFGGALAIWGLLRKPEAIVQVRERVLTNMVDRVVNVPVTSYVTSVVERVSIVTNTIPVVQREIVTNTIERVVAVEHVVTNEIVKVVLKEASMARRDLVEIMANPAANDVTNGVQKKDGMVSKSSPTTSVSRGTHSQFATQETWLDRVILGFYKKLGLMPDTRPYFKAEGEK